MAAIILRRWRMHRDTLEMVELEALKGVFSHLMLSDGARKFFMNMPVTFDPKMTLGVIILELDREAMEAAKRSATTQA